LDVRTLLPEDYPVFLRVLGDLAAADLSPERGS